MLENTEIAAKYIMITTMVVCVAALLYMVYAVRRQYAEIKRFRRQMKRGDKVTVRGIKGTHTVWANYDSYAIIRVNENYYKKCDHTDIDPATIIEWEIV